MQSSDLYRGKTVRALRSVDGFAELCFDREGDAINKLDRLTFHELNDALAAVEKAGGIRGALVTSAKDVFIVGADITEFGELFGQPEAKLAEWFQTADGIIDRLENLPMPTVVAINGYALGGGFELTLAADYRVMSSATQVGLPEVALGLFPGYGGTVRLPRIAGVRTAVDWIGGGQPRNAQAALEVGAVDEQADPAQLRDAALNLLRRAADGALDWRARRRPKQSPVAMSAEEAVKLFAAARDQAAQSSPKHQPAALEAIDLLAQSIGLDQAQALALEAAGFARIAKTQAADSLIQAFLNDQALKKKTKSHVKSAHPVKQAAVLGAGIMGGGIAYASALKGIPVRMKDVAQERLDLGLAEARKQLAKQVKSGKLQADKAETILATITPQLDYDRFDTVDFVIEAVVEKIEVKHAVLRELATIVAPNAVIASNTSSLRIDDLAAVLQRPENFVGMHFFNPVPVMPLVEIIRGARTGDAVISTAVNYATAMGKTPIVVKDCPGFLVNRLLTAYMRAFLDLVVAGADFVEVDRVMEAFGWPMGPAYLEDVIGLDTGAHVNDVISAGYPQRMPPLKHDALRLMLSHKRLGQKNGVGFYRYEADPAGKPKKLPASDTHALLATLQSDGVRTFEEQEIIERMMLPMIIEAAHALEEGIVATAAELDTAMVLGLGFPRYAGGPLKYADWLGLGTVVKSAEKYSRLGKQYEPTATLRDMAKRNAKFHAAG